ncbi:MAG: Stealth CR1 domain-containing protein [Opitutales bacterium]|nr:Stealth CR1 domain-containing protein [Opitutales bacterium]
MTQIPANAPADADPIDAVVTWVDGNDPAHRAKREAALTASGKSPTRRGLIPAGKDPTRFTDNGEIRWCLHSIRKFAPWIRHIHLVTDAQVPAFLTPEKQSELGVRIVDHTEIFRGYEWALPTFNSNTIEAMIWRCPGLSERFIYLNDDFVIIQPVSQGDFFCGQTVRLRGAWQSIRSSSPFHLWLNRFLNQLLRRFFNMNRTMHLYMQMNGARLAGYEKRYFRAPHVPHPLLQSTFRTHYAEHGHNLNQQLMNRFRRENDYFPVSLANHIEIQKANTILEPADDTAMISSDMRTRRPTKDLQRILNSGTHRFVTLQGLERFPKPEAVRIRNLMESIVAQ